ncbi:hypothetical protein H1R20_g1593, partial [Candolleomyces eurysporus]
MMFATPRAVILSVLALTQIAVASSLPELLLESRQSASAEAETLRGTSAYNLVCALIARKVSSASLVHYPGSPVFNWLLSHWSSASNQVSACVVEPATPADVGKILEIVGKARTPFAVQSGGHGTNPGFSSTKGIHISLNSFRSVNYNRATRTVEFGTGLKWEEVYAAIERHGISVLGGRVTGVGVGGVTLGGGYAWKTNQYGLTCDSVTAFELVKPNGEVVKVTQQSDSQLFFGLKGASNNFGIVTKITMKALPQGQVWGGMISYMDPASIEAVSVATSKFANQVTDPKAAILSTFSYYQGSPLVGVQLFYDAPQPPAGVFDDFLSIPAVQTNVSTQSFLSLVQSAPANATYGLRSYFDGVPVASYSPRFLNKVKDLTMTFGNRLASKSLVFMTLVAEPFLPTILSHNPARTAYPFTRSKVYSPFNILFTWADPSQDAVFERAIREMKEQLYAALLAEGQSDIVNAPLYPNYALWDTPVQKIYGSNLPALKSVKSRVDPSNVMGLAGGFKISSR